MSSEQPRKVVAVIPARLDSKRLPRKVLQTIAGKPMIQWVYERTQQARRVSRVFVATDSPEVEAACRAFSSDVWMSKKPHSCGTDRVAEVVRSIEADIVVNVQSDEPMMEPELIDRLVELFDDPEVQMATAANPIKTLGELLDVNVVKMICDKRGDALYFSRAPIPWFRDIPPEGDGPLPEGTFAYRHIGVYLYSRRCLLELAELPRSPLELAESLEQLRAQEYGWKIRSVVWDYKGFDIDTPEELQKLRELWEK